MLIVEVFTLSISISFNKNISHTSIAAEMGQVSTYVN